MKKLINFNTQLYIEPVKYFPDIHEFIFVDTLPCSTTESYSFNENEYNFDFYINLVDKFDNLGFRLINFSEINNSNLFNPIQKIYYTIFDSPDFINPSKITFINYDTNQVANYYINCNISQYKFIDINSADVLFVNKILPSIEIINYFENPKIFISEKLNISQKCNYETILTILNHPKVNCYFNTFYKLEIDDLIACNGFVDLLKK